MAKIAMLYGVLWVITLFFANIIFITIVSGIGVFVLVAVAIGLDGAFEEKDVLEAKMDSEIKELRKEIESLKKQKEKES
jgi:hypothetical protein